MPVLSVYVPAGHSLDDELPAGQYEPAGQGTSVPFTLPPAHTYPAGHLTDGRTVLTFGHTKPGVQDMQDDTFQAMEEL